LDWGKPWVKLLWDYRDFASVPNWLSAEGIIGIIPEDFLPFLPVEFGDKTPLLDKGRNL